MVAAFVFEVVATFLFMVVILGATGAGAPAAMAGLAIGLTLVVIHLVGINVTGVSVNPARSIGPAVISGDASSIAQLWLFIAAPAIGAAVAGILFRTGMLDGTERLSSGKSRNEGAARIGSALFSWQDGQP